MRSALTWIFQCTDSLPRVVATSMAEPAAAASSSFQTLSFQITSFPRKVTDKVPQENTVTGRGKVGSV